MELTLLQEGLCAILRECVAQGRNYFRATPKGGGLTTALAWFCADVVRHGMPATICYYAPTQHLAHRFRAMVKDILRERFRPPEMRRLLQDLQDTPSVQNERALVQQLLVNDTPNRPILQIDTPDEFATDLVHIFFLSPQNRHHPNTNATILIVDGEINETFLREQILPIVQFMREPRVFVFNNPLVCLHKLD